MCSRQSQCSCRDAQDFRVQYDLRRENASEGHLHGHTLAQTVTVYFDSS